MSNKKDGNDFERELCEILHEKYGFWVHNFAQNQAGQPADIIAVRNERVHLIDAKVCKSDTFALSRMEENQRFAMKTFYECGNASAWFALKLSDDIYMMSIWYMLTMERNGLKTISNDMIHRYGRRLDVWANVLVD